MPIDKITGVAFTAIDELSGIAKASIANVSGIAAASGGGIITDNLVQHLDAGNSSSYPGTGTTWSDLSGNGTDATMVNSPTYSATVGGGSFSFDGVDDGFKLAASTSAPIRPSETDLNNDGFTVQIWCKISGTNSLPRYWNNNMFNQSKYRGLKCIYDARTAYGGRMIMYKFDNDGGSGSGSRRSVVLSQFSIPTDFVLFTYRYDTADYDDWRMFQNDSKGTSYSKSGFGSSVGYEATDDGGLMMSRNETLVGEGIISEVIVYDVALTDQEVVDNFDNTKARYGY